MPLWRNRPLMITIIMVIVLLVVLIITAGDNNMSGTEKRGRLRALACAARTLFGNRRGRRLFSRACFPEATCASKTRN